MRRKYTETVNTKTNHLDEIAAISSGEKFTFPFQLAHNESLDVVIVDWQDSDKTRIGTIAVKIRNSDGTTIESRDYSNFFGLFATDIMQRIYLWATSPGWNHSHRSRTMLIHKIRSMRNSREVRIWEDEKEMMGALLKSGRDLKNIHETLSDLAKHHPAQLKKLLCTDELAPYADLLRHLVTK